ncbi:MAG: sialate O-acetylesterase, partial [Chitinophagaceae bacterium]
PKQDIAIIKHAHSGTNLFKQWNPGDNNKDSAKWGEQYKAFVQTVKGGFAALKKMGYKPVIKAILWQQGEGDAMVVEAANKYATNLQHFIKRVRQQFHVPEMLFIYGYVLSAHFEFAGRDAVRTAEKNIDQNSGTSFAVKKAYLVDTDDLSLRANDKNSKYPNDKLHFGTQGNWDLGTRMADTIFKYRKK